MNDIHVQSLESSSIEVVTQSGNITSKSLKGDVIQLTSQSGNINCQGVTQGNITFQSESGVRFNNMNNKINNVIISSIQDIHGHRFQGPNLEIKTATGNISTESIYSDVSRFSSQKGNINLKNLHRQCYVTISDNGNLTICNWLYLNVVKKYHERLQQPEIFRILISAVV